MPKYPNRGSFLPDSSHCPTLLHATRSAGVTGSIQEGGLGGAVVVVVAPVTGNDVGVGTFGVELDVDAGGTVLLDRVAECWTREPDSGFVTRLTFFIGGVAVSLLPETTDGYKTTATGSTIGKAHAQARLTRHARSPFR
jgi:hypothetical protein